MLLTSKFLQDDNYSCGISAVAYFLDVLGRDYDITKLRKYLQPTEDAGTDPKNIEKYLKLRKIPNLARENAEVMELIPPCLVIYQYLGDGHYGVVLSRTKKYLSIFEPWWGGIHLYKISDFVNRWYSKRFEKQWYLRAI